MLYSATNKPSNHLYQIDAMLICVNITHCFAQICCGIVIMFVRRLYIMIFSSTEGHCIIKCMVLMCLVLIITYNATQFLSVLIKIIEFWSVFVSPLQSRDIQESLLRRPSVHPSQNLVQTTPLKLLVGFHSNFTEMISTKSSHAYYHHSPVQ